MEADAHGIKTLGFEPERMLTDIGECLIRGLQNRLRGAVEASRVGSIPIRPRQISRS